jgi:phosphoglycerate dehydrogenase-like enzyme
MLMKIAILDDYQNVALKMADWPNLPKDVKITVFNDHVAGLEATTKRLSDFEIICSMRERTSFQKEQLERLPKLQLLATTAMHNAAIDLQVATQLGIVVSGTSSSLPTTGELAWGLILSVMRQIPQEDAAVRQGKWETTLGNSLSGNTLGVVGLGRVGSQMARVGIAFGMKVIAWSQNLTPERAKQCGAELVTRDDLFKRADVVTLHVRLSDRTLGLVTARELGLMKPTAYLVNTSRGPVVDENALIKALQKNTIAGAGIDVFEPEPLPKSHPFMKMHNVVMTPHLGYVCKETYEAWYPENLEDIKAFLAGKPVRVLNTDVLAKNYRGKR